MTANRFVEKAIVIYISLQCLLYIVLWVSWLFVSLWCVLQIRGFRSLPVAGWRACIFGRKMLLCGSCRQFFHSLAVLGCICSRCLQIRLLCQWLWLAAPWQGIRDF